MAQRHPTIEAAFWAKVDKRGADDCWPWMGMRASRGYGLLQYRGTRYRASRLSWSIANSQPFPADKCACHSCDNPPCVNPAHLWPGTVKENMHDCIAKGRKFAFRVGGYCRKGHLLTEQNLGGVGRKKGAYCKECRQGPNAARVRAVSLTAKGRRSRAKPPSPYGRGKLCRACGHLRIDDYFYPRPNGSFGSQCSQCSIRRTRRRTSQMSSAS